MYKNRKPRIKRPAVASIPQKEKKTSIIDSSSDEDIQLNSKGKSLLTKTTSENVKKTVSSTPQKEKKKTVSTTPQKETKKTVIESSSDDDIQLSGKGKSFSTKTTSEHAKKAVASNSQKEKKTAISESSSDDDIQLSGKGKYFSTKTTSEHAKKAVASNSQKEKKTSVSKSSSDEDIQLSGKGKYFSTKTSAKNTKKIITSTQKSSSDDSSTDIDAPPKSQKRFGENINGKGPAAKRPQLSLSRAADFPASSLAISSIHSTSSSPERPSRIPTGSTRKKKINYNKNVNRPQTGNPFIDQLSSLGFTFGEGEEPNCLDRDQASFVQSLDSALLNHKDYPQNVDNFVRHFETFMNESMSNLGRVLESTQSSDDYARKAVQECLMRLLLNVGCLQPKLWKILLAKISELIIDEEEEEANFEMLHRIMRQMRCLDRVIEGNENICDQLFVILELASKEETKREIILLLPDIISEEDHEKAAQAISTSLAGNHPLIPAYLDTLSSLVLSEETQKDTAERLIKILSRADTKYFQIIIKNLVVFTNNLEPVIRGIRQHLDLDPTAYGNDGNECLMLASTLKEVENKKPFIVAWMELVEETEPQQWLAVDFVALLVNYASAKVPVMAAFKKLAARGADGERDVEKVYPAIKSILEYDYLETIRQILDSLFKSRSVLESRHASFWYRFLLNNIEASHVSQKILDDVMCHISQWSSNPADVSLALNSLIDAANEDKDSVFRHTQRLLTLMHYLESWPLPQVRQVMNLLLSLVYHKEEAASMQDNLTITIRKHLNHPSFE